MRAVHNWNGSVGAGSGDSRMFIEIAMRPCASYLKKYV